MEFQAVIAKGKERYGAPEGVCVHLGIFSEPYLGRLLSGEKTLESRITMSRVAPYGRVRKGDVVFVKRNSGPVEAAFTVGEVREYTLGEGVF